MDVARELLSHAPLAARINFVKEHTALAGVPFVPEVNLFTATDLTPLWRATQAWLGQVGMDVPFWSVPWAGGQALARYVLDHPEVVRGLRVVDFGAGSGLVAIAAMKAGAASVRAVDIDPLAEAAITLNSVKNGVLVSASCMNIVGEAMPEADVLFAGDVWYERAPAHRFATWFTKLARQRVRIITGDPERAYVPSLLVELARYEVPTAADLESSHLRTTRVLAWR